MLADMHHDTDRAETEQGIGDPAATLDAFLRLTLPKARWTHEAHLTVCWATLRELAPAAALVRLRAAIRAYNAAVGTVDDDTNGYHETLTRYFVGAVAALADRELAAVLADPTCGRDAPLSHWSRDRLFSVAARRAWVDPDVSPLRWDPAALGLTPSPAPGAP